MTRNQLPEGVGKKIVEALKRQTEVNITPVESVDNTMSSNVVVNEINQEIPQINFEQIQQETVMQPQPTIQAAPQESMIVEEPVAPAPAPIPTTFTVNTSKEDAFASQFTKEPVQETPIFKAGSETTTVTFNQMPSNSQVYSGVPLSEEPISKPVQSSVTISIPTNVAVLKNLIASLPVGVAKQTGAQIIRQTLEAMGLPMSNVLKEAQEVQEELNANTRECMLKIQEYKTNIMQLEQSVQEYQKNITQINDLVSLFLLTDRK